MAEWNSANGWSGARLEGERVRFFRIEEPGPAKKLFPREWICHPGCVGFRNDQTFGYREEPGELLIVPFAGLGGPADASLLSYGLARFESRPDVFFQVSKDGIAFAGSPHLGRHLA